MFDNTQGGNDNLVGSGAGSNELFGDASTISGAAQGGNDNLIGGAGVQNSCSAMRAC